MDILTIGGILVEVMRKELDKPLSEPADFTGPYPSGEAGIFISAAARLGNTCAIVGSVGDDQFADCVMNRFKADGVDTNMIQVIKGATTGTAFVCYYTGGKRNFIFHWRQAAAGTIDIDAIDTEHIKDFKIVHATGVYMSVNENCIKAAHRVIESADKNAIVSFDPNVRPELLSIDKLREVAKPVIDRANIVFPSEGEAMMFAGAKDDDTGCRMLADLGKIVVLKRGDKGCRIYSADEIIDVPSFNVTEVDPTGAGDSFCAGFLTAMKEGKSLYEAGRFANAVGALAVTKQGPMEGCPFRDAVEELLSKA